MHDCILKPAWSEIQICNNNKKKVLKLTKDFNNLTYPPDLLFCRLNHISFDASIKCM